MMRQINDEYSDWIKAVATVRDVARMVGLSPARFYQLQKAGVFPMPVYDLETRRPFYTEVQQRQCLEVRRRNCGINGKPVLFYARRIGGEVPLPRSRRPAVGRSVKEERHDAILGALKDLGLSAVTAFQVGEAVRKVFPGGTGGVAPGEVVRSIFLHLKRQNSGDSVGR